MASSDLVVLAILPATIWASLAFVALSTTQTASKLRTASSVKSKRELNKGARLWVLHGLTTYLVVLVGVVVWVRTQASSALETVLTLSHWPRQFFHGIVLGLALTGLLLVFRRFFPEVQKFGFLILAGVASPVWVRILALLLVAFTEELWRAVCLTILVAEGFSGPQAVVASTAAYGLAYFAWGYPVAISEGVLGAVCGGLYLWSGSLFVPLAAHLTLRSQHLLYAVAASPDAEPGDIYRRPHATCPACGAALNFRQVNFNVNEAFFCPACHTRVTASDRRRAFQRWGFVFLSIALMLACFDIFPGAVRGKSDEYWTALVVMWFAGTGLWSILQIIFPPNLECGDPDFVRLNLRDRDVAGIDKNNKSEVAKGEDKDST